ncbi:hypothetical protein NEOLEDRAFT_1074005 [Neolentinus lepideus HHB14362 ss-1]|uniref:Uncharacterized protein n=1 Tax=Neolentinus lepideus HHB14362 ss-1 TaxID=1314782 RepID=A0A165PL96_9AGAM|nr:hypothetical protein NEOLEDRAFT_1074005 [Neolentinus lepideus HHB14362 ss-1]
MSSSRLLVQKQRKIRNSFLALVRDILFSVLLIYSLFVCSPDKPVNPDSHPICRALSNTHHRLVEPYILTPLRPALEHPSVAPYVQRIEPYRQRVINTGEFVIDQTRTQWIRYVIPQWNKRVVPQWDKRIVPELRKLERKIEPYRAHLEREYQRAVAPRIRLVQYNLERWYSLTQPYVILAGQKAQTGYRVAKPYTVPVWHQFQQLMMQLYALFQEQRRKFVDPHLVTLWEKVTELSSGQSQQVKSQVYSAVSNAKELKSTLTSQAISGASSVSATLASVAADAESTASSFVAGEATEVDIDTPLASVPATGVEAEVPSAFSSTTSTWSHASESVAGEGTRPFVSSVAPPQQTLAPGGEDHDLNEFIEIIGNIDVDEVDPAPEETEPEDVFASMPNPSETAEEKEARLAAVAEKRRDIVARHEKWEQDLEALIKEKRKALRKALVALRKMAVTELKESKEIQEEVEILVQEAEKFLKGADGYLKTLKKEERSAQDKERLWGKVLDRVEKKFEERIEKVSALVNEWHGTVQSRELQEVNDVAEAVKDLAERAQADIGMDYAWLDDVDYYDWVRYHDLIRTSENFTEQAHMIQNGSHPSPPINPVLGALDDLEAEIEDIVTGFQTRMRGLKRSGQRAFGDSEENTDAPTSPLSPIPGVSILPVLDAEKSAAIADGVPPVPVIGRSREEVLEALGRLEAQEQTQPGTPGKSDSQQVTPEVVEQLAQDVDAEAASHAVAMSHKEL